MPEQLNKIIRRKFRIKDDDTLPFVNHHRRRTRKDIASLFNALGYKVGAEIGVHRGRFAKILFDNIHGLKLYCVDPWVAYESIRPVPQEKVDREYAKCLSRLNGLNVQYLKMTSMEAINIIPDNSLDFVYIDGLHEFNYVMMDIICWSNKVREGGIVSGRNYFPFYRSGAMIAVDAYTHANNINEWYVVTADTYPSYFWVKGA